MCKTHKKQSRRLRAEKQRKKIIDVHCVDSIITLHINTNQYDPF